MVGVYLFLSVFAQYTPFSSVSLGAPASTQPAIVQWATQLSAPQAWHNAVTLGTRIALASELMLAPSVPLQGSASAAPLPVGSLPSASPTRLTVLFEELNGLSVGSPVISRGEKIGTVVAVEAMEQNGPTLDARDAKIVAAHSEQPVHTAQIELDAEHRELARVGTVALLASPRTIGRAEGDTIIELFAMSDRTPILESGAKLAGYSSYEAFWSGRKAKPAA